MGVLPCVEFPAWSCAIQCARDDSLYGLFVVDAGRAATTPCRVCSLWMPCVRFVHALRFIHVFLVHVVVDGPHLSISVPSRACLNSARAKCLFLWTVRFIT